MTELVAPGGGNTPNGIRAVLAGAGSVGGGLVISGLSTYLFLALTARATGPAAFGSISALWAITMIVGPGLFLPVQQEVGRLLASSRANGVGRSVILRSAVVAGTLVVAVIVATGVAGGFLVDRLFDGDWRMVVAFLISVVGYAGSYLGRGLFSGLGEFRRFGALVVVEAVSRLVIAIVLWVMGANTAAPYGFAIGFAPLIAAVVVTGVGSRFRLAPGRHVAWSDLTQAFGWLVVASIAAQILANAGPLAVKWAGGSVDPEAAGQFLSALLVARVTLYLFQAVQAALIPNVAALVAAGDVVAAYQSIRSLVRVILALFVASILGAYAWGPWAVTVMFGEEFRTTRISMAVLAGGTSCYILGVALTGVALALGGHGLNAASWFAGCVAFGACLLLVEGVVKQAELGYAAGSVVSAGALYIVVQTLLHQARREVAEGYDRT